MTERLIRIVILAVSVACTPVGSLMDATPSPVTTTSPTPTLDAVLAPPTARVVPTSTPPSVLPPVLEITATAFVEDLAWIVTRSDSTGELLRHSDDGGATWAERSIPSIVNHVDELQFVDPNHGWMIGFAHRGLNSVGCAAAAPLGTPTCRQTLFRTSDGGRSWSALRTVPTWPAGGASLVGVQFVDERYGWILERRPCPTEAIRPCFDLLATSNAGDTWASLLVGQHLGQVRVLDRRHGWALTRDTQDEDAKAIATADGGRTWHTQLVGEPLVMLAVPSVTTAFALSVDHAYCTASFCARYGFFRVDGGALSTVHPTASESWKMPDGCGGVPHQLVFVDARQGWITQLRGAGGAGVRLGGLLRTMDGGLTWSCAESPPDETVLWVHFVNATHAWLITRTPATSAGVGTMRLWRTVDGGVSWRRVIG